ncbi:MAG: HAAS signaling domain-containing protein [Bacillus sp. (in: firmicutes)]
MNKKQFLTTLEQEIQSLPIEEQEEILYDYNEYFTIGESEGKTEEEIADGLGTPKSIAKEIKLTSSLEQMEKNPGVRNTFHVIGASLGLSLLNLIIVLGPAIAIASTLLAFWIVSIAMIINPLLTLSGFIFGYSTFYPFEFFVGIAASGTGILLLYGSRFLTVWCWKAFISYCRWNMKVIRGGYADA